MARDRTRFPPPAVLAEDWTDGWTRPTRDLTFLTPRPQTRPDAEPPEPEPAPEQQDGAA